MSLSFHAFAASARPVSDAFWEDIQLYCFEEAPVPRESCIQFGGPDEGYLIHVSPEGYHVHAWWYTPLVYPTLSEAISHLWPWYQEWQD